MVSYVVYGRGSFNQLDEILAPHRKGTAPMIFLVDHFFEGKPLLDRIPLRGNDKILLADVTHEPKTTQVDALAFQLKQEFGTISGIIGIGGGSTMDLAKAVSLMMTNPGSSADYQGWDLVKQAGDLFLPEKLVLLQCYAAVLKIVDGIVHPRLLLHIAQLHICIAEL